MWVVQSTAVGILLWYKYSLATAILSQALAVSSGSSFEIGSEDVCCIVSWDEYTSYQH